MSYIKKIQLTDNTVYDIKDANAVSDIKINGTSIVDDDRSANITGVEISSLGFESSSNKVSSWSTATDNTHYPSEKLVKDSLDAKADENHTHTHEDVTDLGTAALKGVSTSITSSSSNLPTTKAVYEFVESEIEALPQPMIFKGSLGEGGTVISLPPARETNTGFTYKVITAGTYAGQEAKVGDTFISDGTQWVLIPSGDEPSGTVTSVGVSSSTLTVTGSPITSSGTITVEHPDSRVTPGTYGEGENITIGLGDSFQSFNGTVDQQGHLSKAFGPTITITGSYNDLTDKPTIPVDTNQKVKVGRTTFGVNDEIELVSGHNVTVEGNAANKQITISATDTTYEVATTTSDGLLSSTDKATINNLKTVATTGNYNDLSNKPDINDATLTIKENDVTVGSFSANASNNQVVELESIKDVQVDGVSVVGNDHIASISLQSFETTSNKVSAWSSTVSNTHYPSEKLVKDSLDGKANSSHTHPASDISGLPTNFVSSVTAGAGLTGGTITSTGTIALATSGASAGTYNTVTVDTYGRVTSGQNVSIISATDTGDITTLGLNADTLNGHPASDFLLASAGNNYLLKSGGTMTGSLILSGAPTSNNMAATKKYVDDAVAGGSGGISQAWIAQSTAPSDTRLIWINTGNSNIPYVCINNVWTPLGAVWK